MVHEQLKLTRDLGAKVLRIFAAWNGITFRDGVATYEVTRANQAARNLDSTKLERWRWVYESIRECARWAEEYGVILALQNHEPLIRGYEYMIDMVNEVDSPWVKCCLDAPCEPSQEDEYLRQAVQKTGSRQVLSHYNGEWVRDEGGKPHLRHFPFLGVKLANYPVFVDELKRAGYGGYMCFEFCHPALRDHVPQGIEYVHEQTSCAYEYMRALIDRR